MTNNFEHPLYKRSKKIIPGGTHLFSKKPELFLPKGWPTYFEKTDKCYVWDLEGKKYIDTCLMGVGTNSYNYR